jgi:hypothetical protein
VVRAAPPATDVSTSTLFTPPLPESKPLTFLVGAVLSREGGERPGVTTGLDGLLNGATAFKKTKVTKKKGRSVRVMGMVVEMVMTGVKKSHDVFLPLRNRQRLERYILWQAPASRPVVVVVGHGGLGAKHIGGDSRCCCSVFVVVGAVL